MNTGNGISHTIALTLRHDPGLGDAMDGGVTKKGAGTLALTNLNGTAVCTFTGPVNVNGGTLVFTPIMTNDVTLANNTVLSVPRSAKIGALSGRGTVTGNEVAILGTITIPTSGTLTASPDALTIADTATIDFGRNAENAVKTADKIAVLDVSGVGSLVVPESVRGVNSGRDDQPRVSLTVEDGTLYATIAPSGTTLIFR